MKKARIVTIGSEVLRGRIRDRVEGELKTAGLLKKSFVGWALAHAVY